MQQPKMNIVLFRFHGVDVNVIDCMAQPTSHVHTATVHAAGELKFVNSLKNKVRYFVVETSRELFTQQFKCL